jgi:protein-L-isoaspartate(D-aspartate) O-methyltransferase
MTMVDFELARRNMVDHQVRTNRVTDPLVVDALRAIPRELFVPAPVKGVAYLDDDIEVVPGRFLIEPMVLARLLQLAEVRRTDTVLDVGCASGYSSAVLGRMATSVVALDRSAELVSWAAETLLGLGIDNVAVVEGEMAQGLPDQGPYDVIFVNGAVEWVPDGLRAQLNEGGRLVAVVRDKGIGRATLMTRRGGAFGHRVEFDAEIAPLPGFHREAAFVF